MSDRGQGKGGGNDGNDTLVPRGRDELDFLPSRAESTPLDRATIDAHLQGLRSRVKAARRGRGLLAHELGTTLNLLYMRHADAVLDKDSFGELLAEQWQDELDDAVGSMLVARLLTAAQAEEHGYWKAIYAVRLMRKLGLATFSPLEKRSFDLPDGRRVTFQDLSTNDTKRLASQPALTAGDDSEEKAGRTVLKLRARAAELAGSRPEYAELKVRIYLQDGEPVTAVKARGKAGADAARRFLAELWRPF